MVTMTKAVLENAFANFKNANLEVDDYISYNGMREGFIISGNPAARSTVYDILNGLFLKYASDVIVCNNSFEMVIFNIQES